jgi:hypothetical protein
VPSAFSVGASHESVTAPLELVAGACPATSVAVCGAVELLVPEDLSITPEAEDPEPPPQPVTVLKPNKRTIPPTNIEPKPATTLVIFISSPGISPSTSLMRAARRSEGLRATSGLRRRARPVYETALKPEGIPATPLS